MGIHCQVFRSSGDNKGKLDMILPLNLITSVRPGIFGLFVGRVIDAHQKENPENDLSLNRVTTTLWEELDLEALENYLIPGVKNTGNGAGDRMAEIVHKLIARRSASQKKRIRVLTDEEARKAFGSIGIKIAK